MIWKVIIVFLCAMALVGMVGKLLFPDARLMGRRAGSGPQKKRGGAGVVICNDCGRPQLGKAACGCRARKS